MRNSFRFLLFIFFIAAYGLSVKLITNSPFLATQNKTPTKDRINDIPSFSNPHFYLPSEVKDSEINLISLSLLEIKEVSKHQWPSVRAIEILVESEFSQYNQLSQHIRILQPKTNLIFPFHYFW